MGRIFCVVAPLLTFLSCAAVGAPSPDVYTIHCSGKDVVPETVHLEAYSGGKLFWNGTPITSKEFEIYLTDVTTRTKGENVYFFLDRTDNSSRSNIIATLKKHGMVRRPECRVPLPVN